MEKLQEFELQQIEEVFSVENLQKQCISYDTVKQINRIVLQSLTEVRNLRKQLEKTLIPEESIVKVNIHYIIKNYKEEYEKFKDEITKMKDDVIENQGKILNQTTIYNDLLKFLKRKQEDKIVTLQMEEYYNIEVIYKIDDFTHKFLNFNELNRLISWFQDKKELSAIVYKYEKLYHVLKKYRKEIVKNEYDSILEENGNLIMEDIYFYILKMVKFYLISYYYSENMVYTKISKQEIFYASLIIFEFIFGFLNTSIFLLFCKNYYSFVDLSGENTNDFESDPFFDEQLIKLDNYKIKIKDEIINNFGSF